jgi:mannose-6-phosphate isomerase-like protein (cupin superfamily)
MIETFEWTGGVVFSSPQVTVAAGIDPSWDLLEQFFGGAVFGFVLDGENAILTHRGRPHSIGPGYYFVVNAGAEAHLLTPGGRVLLIHQHGADFPFMVGGPIETRGRLKYIDGCTDSLIIPPWRRGEACMNHLHIPAGTEQTMHTHPSDRIGVIVRGSGQCVTPQGIIELKPGMLWRIPPHGLHRFRTERDSLDVVAWHPDSDTGPTDDDHPMLNRSLVNGVSAAEIDAIRTR